MTYWFGITALVRGSALHPVIPGFCELSLHISLSALSVIRFGVVSSPHCFFSSSQGVPKGQLVGGPKCRHDQQCGGGAGHDTF